MERTNHNLTETANMAATTYNKGDKVTVKGLGFGYVNAVREQYGQTVYDIYAVNTKNWLNGFLSIDLKSGWAK